MQRTGNNKQQKHVLRQQGVDPAKVEGDALFWLKGGTTSVLARRTGRRCSTGLSSCDESGFRPKRASTKSSVLSSIHLWS
jgi:hypothetical protein